MRTRYAVMAMSGINDPSTILKHAGNHPVFWDAFADAKADVVALAEALHEYLASSNCEYQMHCESGDHHYAVRFEYGAAPRESTFPFKTVLHVCKCTVMHGQIQEIEL